MIICFNEKINNFNEKSLKKFKNHSERSEYIQTLMPGITDVKDCKCPYCKTKNSLIKYGHYNRNISIYEDKHIENYNVSVQRVMCKGCVKTHALLPNFIVPYVIMAIFSITKIVSEATKSSVYKLYKKINISYQLIYLYMSMILAFFTDFKILNNIKEYVPVSKFNEKYFLTNCDLLSTSNFRLDFFAQHNWFLFMIKFRNNPSPPVGIFISNVPPT